MVELTESSWSRSLKYRKPSKNWIYPALRVSNSSTDTVLMGRSSWLERPPRCPGLPWERTGHIVFTVLLKHQRIRQPLQQKVWDNVLRVIAGHCLGVISGQCSLLEWGQDFNFLLTIDHGLPVWWYQDKPGRVPESNMSTRGRKLTSTYLRSEVRSRFAVRWVSGITNWNCCGEICRHRFGQNGSLRRLWGCPDPPHCRLEIVGHDLHIRISYLQRDSVL